jgi:hypothetical protein
MIAVRAGIRVLVLSCDPSRSTQKRYGFSGKRLAADAGLGSKALGFLPLGFRIVLHLGSLFLRKKCYRNSRQPHGLFQWSEFSHLPSI